MKYQVFLYIIIVILIMLNINSIYLLLTTKRKYTTKFIEDKTEQFYFENIYPELFGNLLFLLVELFLFFF